MMLCEIRIWVITIAGLTLLVRLYDCAFWCALCKNIHHKCFVAVMIFNLAKRDAVWCRWRLALNIPMRKCENEWKPIAKSCHMYTVHRPTPPTLTPWLINRKFYVKLDIPSIPLFPFAMHPLWRRVICRWWKWCRYLHRIWQQGAGGPSTRATWDYDCLNIDSTGFFSQVCVCTSLLAATAIDASCHFPFFLLYLLCVYVSLKKAINSASY